MRLLVLAKNIAEPNSFSGAVECEIPIHFGFNYFLSLDENDVGRYYDGGWLTCAFWCMLCFFPLFISPRIFSVHVQGVQRGDVVSRGNRC